MKKELSKTANILIIIISAILILALLVVFAFGVRYAEFAINFVYHEYKEDMNDRLDVDGCKDDLEILKDYLLSLRYTVDKRDDFSGSFFVTFKENENGEYIAEANKGKKTLIFECSEDIYLAFKNVLTHASDTAPIVTVLVTETDIILNTIDGTGDYALVYSPDKKPQKNAVNCDYTRKAGDGWYHIWY